MRLRHLPHRNKMFILSGVLLAMTLGALDGTIVGPALPVIVRELGGMELLTWVFTVYSLTSTITIPVVGKLSDLYGRKWFYLAGIVVFMVGSALCGLATDMTSLIVFRALQGIGGGTMMANAMAIIGDLFTPRERGKYQGLVGGVFGVSSVIGPMIGGWLTDALSWRWIFYVNVPFGLLALVVLFVAMPKPELGSRHKVDWAGAAALTVSVVPLLIALNSSGIPGLGGTSGTVALLGIALAGALAFVFIERRAEEPILELRLFKDRSFTASMTVLFLTGVGMFGVIMFLPLFMQIVQGASASSSGALLTPMMLALPIASMTAGQLIARTGHYKVLGIAGIGAATVGMFLLSNLGVDTSKSMVVFDMVLIGLGLGVTMPLFTISLQAQFQDRIGEVTGALQFFRQIGGTVGVALLGGIMNASFASRLGDLVVRHRQAFGAAETKLLELTAEPSKLLNSNALQDIASQLPAGSGEVLTRFFNDVKTALASGIGDAFFVGFVMLALAFVVMFFVREVPLGEKPHVPAS